MSVDTHGFRSGSKQFMIAALADRGMTKRQAFEELKPLVVAGIEPMVFKENVNGRRVPKSEAKQIRELRYAIGRIYAKIGRAVNADFDSDEIPVETPDDDAADNACDECGKVRELFHHEPSGRSLCADCLTAIQDPPKVPKSGKDRLRTEWNRFVSEVHRIREFCNRRAEMSDPIDRISMRVLQAGSKLIPVGIPADALLDSMTMHWPQEARKDAGIKAFNFESFSLSIMVKREIDPTKFHKLFGYALLLAEARQPIMLIGPFGSGKSHIAKQIADYLGAEYGETPMTPGATRGDLLGRHTIAGFMDAEFCDRYENGGVFNFEELDASDAAMVLVLNNALAQDALYNSANGKRMERHEDFIAVSTANTFGLGANREHNARERLDAATIDRWRMGRIFVDIDPTMEKAVFTAAFERNLRGDS